MKWRIVLCIVLVSVALPVTGFAADTETARITAMRTLIATLNEQILLLTEKLEAQEAVSVLASPHVRTIDDLKVSSFYSGDYAALYETVGTVLVPIGGQHVRPLDQTIWNRFVTLVGDRYARINVQEFRVYSDRESTYDAFSDLDQVTGKWILGFNVYGIDLSDPRVWEDIDDLLLHEYGHMVIDANQDIYTAFVTKFWNTTRYLGDDGFTDETRYEAYPQSFVSEYAAASPLEDSVESFVAFVHEPGRSGMYERDIKRNFFFAYPAFVAYRTTIQSSL